MKRLTLFACVAVAVTVLSISCKQSAKDGVMVPKDAGIVVHINASSLSSKLSWKEIQETDWFKDLYMSGTDSLAKKLMDDPAQSGIDAKKDLVFFLKKQGKGGYLAFEGSVKDAAAFEAFNKHISRNANTVKEGDFSSITLENKALVTWNKDRFAYVADAPVGDANFSMQGDGQEERNTSFPLDSLKKFAKQLFELKGDNSLSSDDKFASLLKETGDVHLWMNTQNLYGGLGAGMLSLMKMNVLLEGNVSAMTLNFDNGKISMNSRQYYNDELQSLVKKYSPKSIDADVINRIPSKNVVGAFVMNYPPEGIKEFIKLIGVDGMVNGFLGEAGYSVDEFIKANKGDVVLAVSDFSLTEQEVTSTNLDGEPFTYVTTKPDFKVLFSTSVNDKAAFDKLIATIQKQLPSTKPESLGDISYNLNDNWFTVSNSQEYVNKFQAGTNNKLPFTDKISGHPFGGYIDIQKILTTTEPTIKGEKQKQGMAASIGFWQDIVFHGGELKDGAITSYAEVNLVDKNTNSLKQLNKYLNTMSQLDSKRKSEAHGEPQHDDEVSVESQD
jgi:hypothetical protein